METTHLLRRLNNFSIVSFMWRIQPQNYGRDSNMIEFLKKIVTERRGRGAMARAPDDLVSHVCVPVSNPAVPVWGFRRTSIVSPFSMLLGDHVNGGVVELRLRPRCVLLTLVTETYISQIGILCR